MDFRTIKHDTNITSLRPAISQQKFNLHNAPDIVITMLENTIAKQIFNHLVKAKTVNLPTNQSEISFVFKYETEIDPCDPYQKSKVITKIQVELQKKQNTFDHAEILETHAPTPFYFLFQIITNDAIIEKMQFQICYDRNLPNLEEYDAFGDKLYDTHPYVLREIQTFIENNRTYVKQCLGISLSINTKKLCKTIETLCYADCLPMTLECFDLIN
jgi:hypothetical protein